VLCWGGDGTVRVRDVQREADLPSFTQKGLRQASLSADGKRLLCWGGGTLRVRDVDGKADLDFFDFTDNPRRATSAARFSADGRRVLCWGDRGTVRVRDVEAHADLVSYRHPAGVQEAWWCGDEALLLHSWGEDGSWKQLDLRVEPWLELSPDITDEDLALEAEAHTGMRLDMTGGLLPLSRRDWLARTEQLHQLRAKAAQDR
jgi:hypothetical protein